MNLVSGVFRIILYWLLILIDRVSSNWFVRAQIQTMHAIGQIKDEKKGTEEILQSLFYSITGQHTRQEELEA